MNKAIPFQMKKIFVVFITFLVSTSLYSRPTGLNVGGGLSLDFVNTRILEKNSSEVFFGPYAEVGYDFKFTRIVGLYFGARYNVGFKVDYDFNKSEVVSKAGVNYLSNLSCPIYLSFYIPAGKSTVFINLGPTLDCWIGYRSIMVTTSIEEPISITNLFDNTLYNRFNIYFGGAVGVNIKNHVKVYGAYDQSLINYMKIDDSKRSAGLLRIGAAYVF